VIRDRFIKNNYPKSWKYAAKMGERSIYNAPLKALEKNSAKANS